MIFSQSAQQYFREMVSKVAAGAGEKFSKTPYWIENDLIINNYECIRAVWTRRSTISNACSQFSVARSSYYELENKFIKHGVLGLFSYSNGVKQHKDIEKLVLLVKKCHPRSSHTEILRVAEALPLTEKVATLELISNILNSHGYGHANMNTDPSFWGRIQRSIKEVDRASKSMISGRDKKNRKETFFVDNESCHNRLECLRELFFKPKAKVKSTCIQFNIPLKSYYRIVQDYRIFGVWAIVSASAYGKRDSISNELQLKIILEKLKNPSWSPQQMVDQFQLKCSRFVVDRVLKRWKLTDKGHSAVSLQQFLPPSDAQVSESLSQKQSAFHLMPEKTLLESHRINRHFELICKKMQAHTFNICDPGPLLLAPFISNLGIVQALEMYGPEKQRGKELTSLTILNVMRIISGYRRINHLGNFKDRSVAFASGIGMFGSSSKFYERTMEFKFKQLHKLRSDLVLRGKELDLIKAIKIAFDFHFKEFFGASSENKGIGKGPDKSGKMVPGFRPHVAWDLATNVIINIAYYQGGVRGPSILREFCEHNIFSILDPLTIREIYMDSEYTKESDIHYFKEVKCTNGDVYICLKKNKQIKKLIQPALDEAEGWEVHNSEDEKKAITVTLPKTGLLKRL